MKLLASEIDGEVTIRVWNAKDRSKPTKWRRTVPERAPHRAVSYREGPQNEPKMRSNLNERVPLAYLKATTLATAHALTIGRPGAQGGGRLGSRRIQKRVIW